MNNPAFIFQKWENRLPYYALMKMDEDKICALEVTWGSARKKGVRAALVATFVGGWVSVVKEAFEAIRITLKLIYFHSRPF